MVLIYHAVMILYFGETVMEYGTIYVLPSQLANHSLIKTIQRNSTPKYYIFIYES